MENMFFGVGREHIGYCVKLYIILRNRRRLILIPIQRPLDHPKIPFLPKLLISFLFLHVAFRDDRDIHLIILIILLIVVLLILLFVWSAIGLRRQIHDDGLAHLPAGGELAAVVVIGEEFYFAGDVFVGAQGQVVTVLDQFFLIIMWVVRGRRILRWVLVITALWCS
jgi:hypothetical protein